MPALELIALINQRDQRRIGRMSGRRTAEAKSRHHRAAERAHLKEEGRKVSLHANTSFATVVSMFGNIQFHFYLFFFNFRLFSLLVQKKIPVHNATLSQRNFACTCAFQETIHQCSR